MGEGGVRPTDDLPPLRCYGCACRAWWLAPDSRCIECTRYTVEELTGVQAPVRSEEVAGG